jgi:integrase
MQRSPSVWEQELVVKLLEAVDRSSAKGKRDYAILLLACRLGLRAGDIRTLKQFEVLGSGKGLANRPAQLRQWCVVKFKGFAGLPPAATST